MDISVLTQTFLAVFVLADPLGNAPIVVLLTKGMEPEQKNRVVDRATLVATAILLGFAFVGQPILTYLHISIGSLKVAGGLLLLLVALEMLQGEIGSYEVDKERDVAITPLALPLLAGPGALTTVTLLMADEPTAHLSIITGIVLSMLVTWIIVRQSTRIEKWLGETGAIIAAKLLGFILAALAVEIGSEGIRELFLS
ncbi:MAG: MarC family protein [Cyanobacteria bacterium J069]|nr:MAG: MarC family protein [Cyanobacteria bacterium J069]